MIPLMCRLGFHDWETERFDTGYSHRECHNCLRGEETSMGSVLIWRTRRSLHNIVLQRDLQFRVKQLSEAGNCPDCNGSAINFGLNEDKVIVHCENGHQWISSRFVGRLPCKNLVLWHGKVYCCGVSGGYASQYTRGTEDFECRFGVYRECYEEAEDMHMRVWPTIESDAELGVRRKVPIKEADVVE